MKKAEFKQALVIAATPAIQCPEYLSVELVDLFGGCDLDKKRRWVTLEQVAGLIRGECFTMAGTIDMGALEKVEKLSKRFDLIN